MGFTETRKIIDKTKKNILKIFIFHLIFKIKKIITIPIKVFKNAALSPVKKINKKHDIITIRLALYNLISFLKYIVKPMIKGKILEI